jgi:hypothetical protein
MKPAKQIIKMLLHRNPAVRLRAAEWLSSHHLFRSIVWVRALQNDLEDKTVGSPCVPQVEADVLPQNRHSLLEAFAESDLNTPKRRRMESEREGTV